LTSSPSEVLRQISECLGDYAYSCVHRSLQLASQCLVQMTKTCTRLYSGGIVVENCGLMLTADLNIADSHTYSNSSSSATAASGVVVPPPTPPLSTPGTRAGNNRLHRYNICTELLFWRGKCHRVQHRPRPTRWRVGRPMHFKSICI